jgi:hypothetical protein
MRQVDRDLFDASMIGDLNKAKRAIENGSDVNAKDLNGRTPLHWASLGGQEAIISLLLENGADVNVKDNSHFMMLAEVDTEPSFLYCWKRVPTLWSKTKKDRCHSTKLANMDPNLLFHYCWNMALTSMPKANMEICHYMRLADMEK